MYQDGLLIGTALRSAVIRQRIKGGYTSEKFFCRLYFSSVVNYDTRRQSNKIG